jgi:hypothetical protein
VRPLVQQPLLLGYLASEHRKTTDVGMPAAGTPLSPYLLLVARAAAVRGASTAKRANERGNIDSVIAIEAVACLYLCFVFIVKRALKMS